MDATEIRDISDLAGLAKADPSMTETRWFRGHSDSSWKLVPQVFREENWGAGESGIYSEFQMKAPSRYGMCPPATDAVAWLILAQHYGLPTRLLDWSESILTATFFAVEDEDTDTDGALWEIDPCRINQCAMVGRCVVRADFPGVVDRANAGFSGTEHVGRPYAFQPVERDPRMMLQQATFTLHGNEAPVIEPEFDVEAVRRYAIPGGSKPDLAAALRALGVARSTLFPDLEALAHDVKRITWSGDTPIAIYVASGPPLLHHKPDLR